MVSNAKLLVEFGFIQGSKKTELEEKAKKSGKDVKTFLKELDSKDCEVYADEEAMEFVRLMKPYKTGFPTPINAFRITLKHTKLQTCLLQQSNLLFLEMRSSV